MKLPKNIHSWVKRTKPTKQQIEHRILNRFRAYTLEEQRQLYVELCAIVDRQRGKTKTNRKVYETWVK